jgi:hypothetical protein
MPLPRAARAMIQDRVMVGLERARSSGKRLGRPRTTPFTVRRTVNIGRGMWCAWVGAAEGERRNGLRSIRACRCIKCVNVPARGITSADRNEIVHPHALNDQKLAGSIRLAVHIVGSPGRDGAALADSQQILVPRSRVSTTIGPSRQTKASEISL